MQTTRGIFGRYLKSQPQQMQPGRQAEAPPAAAASAPKKTKPSGRRGLVAWAMSALGLDGRDHAPSKPGGGNGVRQPQVVAPGASATSTPQHTSPGRVKLIIVGDVHGSWLGDREEAALRLLAPDLVLLVGDFGNETVELVRQISELPLPKAVILGNHDAWYTMTGRSGGGSTRRHGASAKPMTAAELMLALAKGETMAAEQDNVRKQLAALGSTHVGYGTMPLDEHGYTVMGARPFSKGGKKFSSMKDFMVGLYGVASMEESAKRIVQVASSAPAHHPLIIMGHNGPTGLGARAFDICGVDWVDDAGDHGDPDLQAALFQLHRSGRRVPLVTFGHMHQTLHPRQRTARPGGRLRRMLALDPATGTVFLNAATVPRVVHAPTKPISPPPSPPSSPKSSGSGRKARAAAKAAAAAAVAKVAVTASSGVGGGGASHSGESRLSTLHHYVVAELDGGEVVSARDVWVQVTPVNESTAAGVMDAAASAAAAATVSATEGGTGATGGAGPSDGVAERIGEYIVQIATDHVTLRTVPGKNLGEVVKFVWNAHDQVYDPHVLKDVANATAVQSNDNDDVDREWGVRTGGGAVGDGADDEGRPEGYQGEGAGVREATAALAGSSASHRA